MTRSKKRVRKVSKLRGGFMVEGVRAGWEWLKDKTFFAKKEYSAPAKNMLIQFGGKKITGLTLRRAPIYSAIDKVLNLVSLGQFEKGKKESQFDTMFHLGIVVHLEGGAKVLLEKNERISLKTGFKWNDVDTEYLPISSKSITLMELLENTRKAMGDHNFFRYNAFENNCQDFVMGILRANGLVTSQATTFVKQDMSKILPRMTSVTKKIAQFTTDSAARVKDFFGMGRIKRKCLAEQKVAVDAK